MPTEASANDVRHDERRHRFLLDRGGLVSYLAYEPLAGGRVDFLTTWVHPELRGRGIGARLVEHALRWAEHRSYKVVPSCWYVAEYVERTPRYRGLLVS